MIISRLVLKNWRNYRGIDVPLKERVFVIGPNASGKSNMLDALRFLRDIAKPGGGLQRAITQRGGIVPVQREVESERSPLGAKFRPSGGDFQGMRVYRSDVVLGRAQKRTSLRSDHRLDEPSRLSLGMVASQQSPLPFHLAQSL